MAEEKKRHGCLTAWLVLMIVLNLYVGVDIIRSLLGLVGVLLLFGVLHIGNENKGWPQLE
jgi:hypothetical protein